MIPPRHETDRLDTALQPAFLSRTDTSELKRGLLGYFYRERPVR